MSQDDSEPIFVANKKYFVRVLCEVNSLLNFTHSV